MTHFSGRQPRPPNNVFKASGPVGTQVATNDFEASRLRIFAAELGAFKPMLDQGIVELVALPTLRRRADQDPDVAQLAQQLPFDFGARATFLARKQNIGDLVLGFLQRKICVAQAISQAL